LSNILLSVVLGVATFVGAEASNMAANLGYEVFASRAVENDVGLAGKSAASPTDARPGRLPDSARANPPEANPPEASPPEPVLTATLTPVSAPVAAEPVALPVAPPVIASQAVVGPPDTGAAADLSGSQPSPMLLALARDTPSRLADGSVFMPIALQRLIGLRTQITRLEPLSPTVEISGRIVTSPDVAALIQATQAGIVESASGAIPRVGSRVRRGDLLGYQRPLIDAARMAELNAKIADLRSMIDMGEQRIVRIGEVMFIRYRQSKIEAVRAEIDSYRRQLRIFEELTTSRVEIRAHTSGVISRVAFVSGQIVEPQATLFEIVDPTRLWVEAAAFDPAVVQDIGEAQAVTGDGQVLALRFSGGGLTLQNQAVPLQFEVIGTLPELQIGKPVTVFVHRKHAQYAGMRLPSAALLRNGAGETVVWERLSAEIFASRPVAAAPLDGASVAVTSGLAANMRVAVSGSTILGQIR
jgi:cobalt-zinc-cadmium efflux system membrane fusion protein